MQVCGQNKGPRWLLLSTPLEARGSASRCKKTGRCTHIGNAFSDRSSAMTTIQRSIVSASASARASRPVPVRAVRSSARSSVVVAAACQTDTNQSSRRQALGAIFAGAVTFSQAAPASAFLGIGDNGDATKAKYETDTEAVLGKVKTVLAIPRGDDSIEDAVKDLRKDINSWVATYRREPLVSGRPSFGNTYSALNALAGHYNNFGPSAPIPKKRLDRLQKELDDATLFVSRHR